MHMQQNNINQTVPTDALHQNMNGPMNVGLNGKIGSGISSQSVMNGPTGGPDSNSTPVPKNAKLGNNNFASPGGPPGMTNQT